MVGFGRTDHTDANSNYYDQKHKGKNELVKILDGGFSLATGGALKILLKTENLSMASIGDGGAPILVKTHEGFCSMGVFWGNYTVDKGEDFLLGGFTNIHNKLYSDFIKDNKLFTKELRDSPIEVVIEGDDVLKDLPEPEIEAPASEPDSSNGCK